MRKDNVSKSNGTEIIGLLYLILATQISYLQYFSRCFNPNMLWVYEGQNNNTHN